ncbi:MAG: acyl-CoA dehydrogenase family protein [Actinomycetota bacterium]|nr:acyl-CoA dehydrogenase family protein [Actinomycetota bacterium]
MAWDFSTEPEFQAKLDWADAFIRDEVEPLDLAFPHQEFNRPSPPLRRVIDPLKQRVRDQGLWACHLGPELGGQGYGQLKLALLNEILGRSSWAPIIFGCQAPDTGNAEIIALYGTEEQKRTYLQPLLDGEIFSCYSMTEPHAGSDPKMFKTRARREGGAWIIDGEKFFSSNARNASFLIVMAVTNPDVSAYSGMSMFLVPADTPGIEIVRHVGTMNEPLGEGLHGWIRYNQVRVPAANLLGVEGQAFEVAQARLGGGRIHHAMRTIARCKQAFDMMCERVLSRETQGTVLAQKQLVQAAISDSWTQIMQLRLLVLYTAWLIDQKATAGARKEISACKIEAARVIHDVVYRAMHIHGAIGVSNEMPLGNMWMLAPTMGIVDGPTEVHQVTVARQVLKEYGPSESIFPSAWLPPRIDEARARFATALEELAGNL